MVVVVAMTSSLESYHDIPFNLLYLSWTTFFYFFRALHVLCRKYKNFKNMRNSIHFFAKYWIACMKGKIWTFCTYYYFRCCLYIFSVTHNLTGIFSKEENMWLSDKTYLIPSISKFALLLPSKLNIIKYPKTIHYYDKDGEWWQRKNKLLTKILFWAKYW